MLSLITAAGRALRALPPPRARGPARAWALFALLAVAATGVRADICKYVDQEGNVHYTNVAPEKGWKKRAAASATTARRAARTPPAAAAARRRATRRRRPGFPRVDPGTQRGRDDVRRKVLADELATEEKLLAEARVAYADGAPPPLPEERADAEKYRARIGELRQALGVHEKNVEALKKEIAIAK